MANVFLMTSVEKAIRATVNIVRRKPTFKPRQRKRQFVSLLCLNEVRHTNPVIKIREERLISNQTSAAAHPERNFML